MTTYNSPIDIVCAHTQLDRQSHKQAHTHTHSLLDIEGASRHSMMPISQLVVLRANHQPSGLVHSAIQDTRVRRGKKKRKTDQKGEEKKDLGEVVALQTVVRHTICHATRKIG